MEETKKIILIVEDEELYQKVLTEKLILEGLSVSSAKDGEEGLMDALKEHPDLILLDLNVPKINGLDVLKKLRQDEWGRNANVIILSALDTLDKVSGAMETGTFDYFVKTDTTIESLVSKIKEKLNIK